MKDAKTLTGQCEPVWEFENIPRVLLAKNQWNPCYVKGTLDPKGNVIKTAKRPIGGPTSPFGMKTLKEIQEQLIPGQYFGFCLAKNDDIVCIDVDHLPKDFTERDLPTHILTLLTIQPTYVEVSPSGQGLHIFYTTNKTQLAHRKDQDKSTKGFEGSVFFRNQFVTVTGHRHGISTKEIASIESTIFESLALHSQRLPTKLSTSLPNQRGLSIPKFTIADIERWLTKIPPNLSESPLQPLLNRAYAQFKPPIENPEDYMHWQYIAAATHHAAAQLDLVDQGEELFTQWSLQGTNDGEQNVRQKYRDNSPSDKPGDLTYLTLVSLASSIKPIWPFPIIKNTQDGPVITDQPDTNNVLNWEALFEQYSLSLRQNEISKKYSVKALTQIQNRYFKPDLETYETASEIKSSMFYFAQANGMEKARSTQARDATEWWIQSSTEIFNPVKDWIDTAPPLTSKDQQVSWFQTLWETLQLYDHDMDREDLYRSYLKKNLMGIIRAHYYTGRWSHTTGIVILQGGEKSRKSSWVENLLPPQLNDYVVSSQAALDGDAKKISLEAGVSQIWLKNEVESFISGSKAINNKDAALKSFLVENHDFYRPLFGKEPIKVKRKCVFFGTTNEPELAMSGTGNRRLQIIPVKQCDTAALEALPIVKVYQELLEEFRRTPVKEQPNLWVLTDTEEQLTNEINDEERKLESGGDTDIREIFNFDAPFDLTPYFRKHGRTFDPKKLWKLKDIHATIYRLTGVKLTSAALKHILKRQVGKWSGSIKRFHSYGNWSVEYGMAKYRSEGKVKQSGYVMPPLCEVETPFEPDMT